MLLTKDLYNQSPGFCALIIREETPSPFPFGCPTDGLPELTSHHYVVVAPRYSVVLLLAAGGGPAFSGGPFHLGVHHQDRVFAPLPEVHTTVDPCPDLTVPADAQRLREDDVEEDEGSIGVPAL